MTYPTETTIILGVIGSVGVIGSLITYMYSANRNQKLELALKKRLDAARAADVIDPELL